jgi:hypothetical protein
MLQCLAALTFTIGLSLPLINGFAQSTPQASKNPVIDFPSAPPNLEEFAHSVDLVVLARVASVSDPVVERTPDGHEYVRRYQSAQIIETLEDRDSNPARRTVTIRQSGGSVEVDGKEISTQYLQKLVEPGQTVLLFLRKANDKRGSYYVALGPAGMITVDGTSVATVPPALLNMPEIRQRSRVPLEELLKSLRTRKR